MKGMTEENLHTKFQPCPMTHAVTINRHSKKTRGRLMAIGLTFFKLLLFVGLDNIFKHTQVGSDHQKNSKFKNTCVFARLPPPPPTRDLLRKLLSADFGISTQKRYHMIPKDPLQLFYLYGRYPFLAILNHF